MITGYSKPKWSARIRRRQPCYGEGQAGILEEDVITEVDRNEVRSTGELLEYIGRRHPGDKVEIKVDRKGREIEFLVTLRNQESLAGLCEKESNEVLEILGIELEEIDNKTARKLNIDGGLRITKILPGKLKRQTDVREGFSILPVASILNEP